MRCHPRKPIGVEIALFVAASEIGRAQLPDQIAALQMVGGNRAFPRVMRETAQERTFVQRPNGVGRQCSEAHAGDIEDGQGIRLLAPWPYRNAEILTLDLRRDDRMVHPLVAYFMQGQLAAEGASIRLALGPLIYNGPLQTREGDFVGVGIDKILLNFRPDGFEHVAKMSDNRVVAQHGMASLENIVHANGHQYGGGNHPGPVPLEQHAPQDGQPERKPRKYEYQMTQTKHCRPLPYLYGNGKHSHIKQLSLVLR